MSTDTVTLTTAQGTVRLAYGYEGWINATGPRGDAYAQPKNAAELALLLSSVGVTEADATTLADSAWKTRPRKQLRSGYADPWEGPWKRHPRGTLYLFLILFIGLIAVIWGLKVGIVGA